MKIEGLMGRRVRPPGVGEGAAGFREAASLCGE